MNLDSGQCVGTVSELLECFPPPCFDFFPLLFFLPCNSFHVFNSSVFGDQLVWNWGQGVGLGKGRKENEGDCGFTLSGDLQESFVLQVFVSCPATPDLTSFHAPDSACDLKSKVLWQGLGLFGTVSEALRNKAREMDNVIYPIKSGQIVPGLEIHGFETCDFSSCVITAMSKDMAVQYFKFLKQIYVYTFRKKQK